METLCIGYNINFDLSRIILDYGAGRYSGKDGFSFKLTEDKSYPRLRIKHLNGRSYNVEFTRASSKYSRNLPKRNRKRTFKGHFLDVCNLACILTDNKSLSLEKACEIFATPIKKKGTETHGKIIPKYINYNIKDTQATYQVFKKVREEYQRYQLDIPMTNIYSAASLGKQALRQCNIQPFLNQNPEFPSSIIGQVMSAYYDGRCECKIRKEPVKVTVLDFFSMYLAITLLLGLWDYVIADKIQYGDYT